MAEAKRKTPAKRKGAAHRQTAAKKRAVAENKSPEEILAKIPGMGRPRTYQRAAELAEDIAAYFEWLDENPLYENRASVSEGQVIHYRIPKKRVATLQGLCGFLGITTRTWRQWRVDYEDFSPVLERAEEAIYQDKFLGASSGLLNAGFLARDLGLADKRELAVEKVERVEMNFVTVSKDEAAKNQVIEGKAERIDDDD